MTNSHFPQGGKELRLVQPKVKKVHLNSAEQSLPATKQKVSTENTKCLAQRLHADTLENKAQWISVKLRHKTRSHAQKLATFAWQQLSGSPTSPGPKILQGSSSRVPQKRFENGARLQASTFPLLDAWGRAHEWGAGRLCSTFDRLLTGAEAQHHTFLLSSCMYAPRCAQGGKHTVARNTCLLQVHMHLQ